MPWAHLEPRGRLPAAGALFREVTGRLDTNELARLQDRVSDLEAALKRSESHYDLLIKHAPAGIYEIDYSVPRFLTVNDSMCRLTGYSRDELLSLNPAEILDDESRKLFAERVRRQLAGQPIDEIVDFRVRRKDGSYVYATLNVAVSPDKPHTALVVGYDVTERRKAEETLRESEAKYRTLFNSMDDGYFLIDVIFDHQDRPVDLFYVEANAAAVQMLGQDYSGKRLSEISPDYEPYWFEIFGRVALTGESVRLERYAEPDRRWYDFYVFKIGGPESRRIGNTFRDITPRVRAVEERELLLGQIDEARQRFQAVVENSSVGIAVWRGEDLVFEVVNPAYLTFAPGKQFTGRRFVDVWPEVADQFVPLLRDLLRTGESYHAEDVPVRIRRSPDGPLEDAFFSISYVVLPPDSSGRRGILNIATETTEQVKARLEAEKLASRAEHDLAELEAVVESMAEGLIISDLDGKVVTMNAEALRLRGFARPEVTSRGIPDFVDTFALAYPDGTPMPPEEWPLNRVLRGESLSGFEARVRNHSTGRDSYWSYSGRLARNQRGEPILSVLTVRDITEEKKVEAALRESESKFSLMFDKAPFAATLSALPDGIIVDVNEAFERTFGYSRAEAVGKTTAELGINPDGESRSRIVADLQRLGSVRDLEMTLQTRSGDRRVFSVSIDLVDIGGQKYILNVTQDVTERKRAEEAQGRLLESEQQARAQAEAAVKVRDDFLSIAAHELKTPVTSLQGYAQVVLRSMQKKGDIEPSLLARSMARIEEQSKRLSKLTDQLLDITRLEAGKLKITPERTDLAALVEGVVGAYQHSQPNRDIKFISSLPVEAYLDPIRTEQVVTNLLDNALKFSPPALPVEVAVAAEGEDWALISVRDHGIGVPAGQRDRIFDRFYQAHNESHYGGMGMGLFISRQIVEMHGGTISAEQPEDGGSRFLVRLPARPSEPPQG